MLHPCRLFPVGGTNLCSIQLPFRLFGGYFRRVEGAPDCAGRGAHTGYGDLEGFFVERVDTGATRLIRSNETSFEQDF